MAKSKSGGTRSYIRGRVGADVYSIGKNGKGAKQQVVRSLAETVANPQTPAQMKGRVIMSTIMQAVAAMAQLIDHSFDGIPVGQPSISEFIRRNYALIKADVAAYPSVGNSFGCVKYGAKGAKQGAYVVADGSAVLPSAIALSTTAMTITVPGDSLKIGDVRSALGLGDDEFITLMGLSAAGQLEFTRIHLNASFDADTAITSANAESALGLESVGTPAVSVAGQVITIALAGAQANSAVIISKHVNGSFKHNRATLLAPSSPEFSFDVAFATYPQGEAMILNGGDFAGGGGATPAPVVLEPAITSVTLGGNAVTKNQANVSAASPTNVKMTATNLDSSKSYMFGLSATQADTTTSAVSSKAAITNNTEATLNLTGTSGGAKWLNLYEVGEDNALIFKESWCQMTITSSQD